jgi:hypothetical protein
MNFVVYRLREGLRRYPFMKRSGIKDIAESPARRDTPKVLSHFLIHSNYKNTIMSHQNIGTLSTQKEV